MVIGWNSRQCRTGECLHRLGVRERKGRRVVKTCTDQKVSINGRKRDTYYPNPSSGSNSRC